MSRPAARVVETSRALPCVAGTPLPSARTACVLVLAAVLLAGCAPEGDPAPPATGSPPADPISTVVVPEERTMPAGPPSEVVPCTGAPPVEFAELCDVYDDVVDRHVDAPDPAALAAAAVQGISDVGTWDVGTSDVGTSDVGPDRGPAPQLVRCAVPHPAFERMCDELDARRATDPSLPALLDGAVQGMFRYGLDPFSSYVPASQPPVDPAEVAWHAGLVAGARNARDEACSPVSGGCRLEVVSVQPAGPADRAGLRVGDVLVRVGGRGVEGRAAEEAVQLLAGRPGTSLVVDAERTGRELAVDLVLADVRFAPAELTMRGSVAHLRLNDFSQEAARSLGRYLGADEVEAARGLLLDLRGNPGGLVAAAQAVASQFVGHGDVVVERFRAGEVALPVLAGGLAVDGPPMVVLVDRGTASSAEIVAAALQERGRAVVAGERTFGKDLVQEARTSREGALVRLSVARWETPGGLDVGRSGLEPDVVIEEAGDGDDPVLAAALDLLAG